MTTNFSEMDNIDLRKYVLEHREDEETFHALVDQFHANPNKVKVGTDEDTEPYVCMMVEREEEKRRS